MISLSSLTLKISCFAWFKEVDHNALRQQYKILPQFKSHKFFLVPAKYNSEELIDNALVLINSSKTSYSDSESECNSIDNSIYASDNDDSDTTTTNVSCRCIYIYIEH